MKNEKQKYRIDVIFSEKKDKHKITETWICNSWNSFKKAICESLDLFVGKNKSPEKPDFAKIKQNLEAYADEKFIKNEFTRQENAFDIYESIMEKMDNLVYIERKIDKNTIICVNVI